MPQFLHITLLIRSLKGQFILYDRIFRVNRTCNINNANLFTYIKTELNKMATQIKKPRWHVDKEASSSSQNFLIAYPA